MLALEEETAVAMAPEDELMHWSRPNHLESQRHHSDDDVIAV